MDGWMGFEGGGEVIWWLLKTQKGRERKRKQTAGDSSGAVKSVTYLLPQCSAAGGAHRGNVPCGKHRVLGCAGALPSGASSSCWDVAVPGHPEFVAGGRTGSSWSHFLLEGDGAGSWNQAQICELP